MRIRIDDFEDGVVPGVCAGTGAPGARLYHVSASSRTPGWAWLGLFAGPAGIVFVFLAAVFLRKTAEGYLPYVDQHQDRMRRRIRVSAGVAAGGFALAVVSLLPLRTVGFATLGYLGVALGGLALVAGLFLWANPPGSVGLTLDSTGRWVEVDNASPAFAVAYEQQEARRRAARRADALDRSDAELR